MGEHCEACGAEINDSTIICKCGCNIQVQRLMRKVELLESANNGWRTMSEKKDKLLADARLVIEIIHSSGKSSCHSIATLHKINDMIGRNTLEERLIVQAADGRAEGGVEMKCKRCGKSHEQSLSNCCWVNCECGARICGKCGSENIVGMTMPEDDDEAQYWCCEKCEDCGLTGCSMCI